MRCIFNINRNKKKILDTLFFVIRHRESFFGINTSSEWDTKKDSGGYFIKANDNETTVEFEEHRSSFVAWICFGVKGFVYSPSFLPFRACESYYCSRFVA